MPFYRFQIESTLPMESAIQRIRTITRDCRPGFFQSVRRGFSKATPDDTAFLGKIDGQSFYLQRDIRYRNSFLPLVWGKVHSGRFGTQITVTMFLQPLVAIFMLFWLSGVGFGGWQMILKSHGAGTPNSFVPLGMFIFGIALTLGGFIPEAIKARRLLEDALGQHGSAPELRR
jgi:hypothetical protein